jgi:hypothetical protein
MRSSICTMSKRKTDHGKSPGLSFSVSYFNSMSLCPCLHAHVAMSMSPCPCIYVDVSMFMSPCQCLHIHVSMSMSPCLYVSKFMPPYLYFSMFQCLMSMCFPLSISVAPCVSMFPIVHLYVSMSPCLHISGIPQTEKGTNRKQQLPFVCYKRKGNGKLTFVCSKRKRKTEISFPWSANDQL